jgi:hypothetical protein
VWALAPAAFVTETLILRAVVMAGAVAMISVSELIVKLAAILPNMTAAAVVKPAPEISTCVPPAVGPLVGVSPVTRGAAT